MSRSKTAAVGEGCVVVATVAEPAVVTPRAARRTRPLPVELDQADVGLPEPPQDALHLLGGRARCRPWSTRDGFGCRDKRVDVRPWVRAGWRRSGRDESAVSDHVQLVATVVDPARGHQ